MSWPIFDEEMQQAALATLQTGKVNYWTGEEGRLFEQEFADYVGTDHAICLANGTLALDAALAGLGIGSHNGGSETDEVIVTPRTFIASVSCVVNAGAIPIFADVDPDTGNLTSDTVAAVISDNSVAVICVHLAGVPCEMAPLMALCEAHNIFVIEDCAQAHGARYRGKSVGSIGHIGAWSFCQDKIMSTGGEGGMITTNDQKLWERIWTIKDHGKNMAALQKPSPIGGFKWVHDDFGTNWRMTEFQAAIGRVQLRRLEAWVQHRASNSASLRAVAARHAGNSGFLSLCATLCNYCDIGPSCTSCRHACYRFYMNIRPDQMPDGWDRDRIAAALREAGVACFVGSCSEVYLEKAFDGTSWRPQERLKVARQLGDTSLALLVDPSIDEEKINHMTSVLASVLDEVAAHRHSGAA